MVKEFVIKKGMLNDVEVKQWEHLKDYRDYCAHPVVGSDFELISPKHEQVRAHIRNMFESIFLKDAILTKKAFDEFITSIEGFYDRNGIERFEEYMKSRYLLRLDTKAKYAFIKNLWKFAFYTDTEECNEYRLIAYRSLIQIILSDKSELLSYLEKERNFINGHVRFELFSIDKGSKDICMHNYCSTALIYLLYRIPEIFKLISKDNIEELKGVTNKNVNYLLLSPYLFPNPKEHVDHLIDELSGLNYCFNYSVFNLVCKDASEHFDTNYNDLAIYYFFNCQNSSRFSPDWDYINWVYSGILKKILPTFTQLQIQNFIEQLTTFHIQANCFEVMANQIKDVVTQKGYSINYSLYTIDLSKY